MPARSKPLAGGGEGTEKNVRAACAAFLDALASSAREQRDKITGQPQLFEVNHG